MNNITLSNIPLTFTRFNLAFNQTSADFHSEFSLRTLNQTENSIDKIFQIAEKFLNTDQYSFISKVKSFCNIERIEIKNFDLFDSSIHPIHTLATFVVRLVHRLFTQISDQLKIVENTFENLFIIYLNYLAWKSPSDGIKDDTKIDFPKLLVKQSIPKNDLENYCISRTRILNKKTMRSMQKYLDLVEVWHTAHGLNDFSQNQHLFQNLLKVHENRKKVFLDWTDVQNKFQLVCSKKPKTDYVNNKELDQAINDQEKIDIYLTENFIKSANQTYYDLIKLAKPYMTERFGEKWLEM